MCWTSHNSQSNPKLMETTMPSAAALRPEQVPADSKPTLDAFPKTIGFTPNMMASFAASPIKCNTWANLLGPLRKAHDVNSRDTHGSKAWRERVTRDRYNS